MDSGIYRGPGDFRELCGNLEVSDPHFHTITSGSFWQRRGI